MTSRIRWGEIVRVRAEGYAAFLAGQHCQTNPYKFANEIQWRHGYRQAEQEAAHAEQIDDPN